MTDRGPGTTCNWVLPADNTKHHRKPVHPYAKTRVVNTQCCHCCQHHHRKGRLPAAPLINAAQSRRPADAPHRSTATTANPHTPRQAIVATGTWPRLLLRHNSASAPLFGLRRRPALPPRGRAEGDLDGGGHRAPPPATTAGSREPPASHSSAGTTPTSNARPTGRTIAAAGTSSCAHAAAASDCSRHMQPPTRSSRRPAARTGALAGQGAKRATRILAGRSTPAINERRRATAIDAGRAAPG